MWLTGNEIKKQYKQGKIFIDKFDEKNINSNSYNYCLYPMIKRMTNQVIDLNSPDTFEDLIIPPEGLILYPGECYLGSTDEVFGSDFFASLVTGRSSVGRKFITNHITAGLIDQGFKGRITLEITVQKPTKVYPHIPFGQIFWFKTIGKARLYDGKYQGQMDPMPSKIFLDLEKLHSKKKKKN